MKVQGSSVSYILQPKPITQRASHQESHKSTSASTEVTEVNSSTSQAQSADLTHMTPMQMREWLNEQLRTGKMTFDESTPFVGMTIGAETNNSPVNYLQRIQDGIDGAAWRGDKQGKSMWEMALDIAERYQYQTFGISTFA